MVRGKRNFLKRLLDKKGSRWIRYSPSYDFERTNLKTITVGDGANDLLMLQRSSFGVAFNGKPKLQENVFSYNDRN